MGGTANGRRVKSNEEMSSLRPNVFRPINTINRPFNSARKGPIQLDAVTVEDDANKFMVRRSDVRLSLYDTKLVVCWKNQLRENQTLFWDNTVAEQKQPGTFSLCNKIATMFPKLTVALSDKGHKVLFENFMQKRGCYKKPGPIISTGSMLHQKPSPHRFQPPTSSLWQRQTTKSPRLGERTSRTLALPSQNLESIKVKTLAPDSKDDHESATPNSSPNRELDLCHVTEENNAVDSPRSGDSKDAKRNSPVDKIPETELSEEKSLHPQNSKRRRLVVDYSAELLSDEETFDPANEPPESALKKLDERGLVYAEYKGQSDNRRMTLSRSDIGRLLPGYFLNDVLINFFTKIYMDELQTRDPVLAGQVHMFSTYFYSQCSEKSSFSRMDPFLKKIPIDKSLYLIPIHGGNHWTLAAVIGFNKINNGRGAIIVLLDSLGLAHVQARAIRRVLAGVFMKLLEIKTPANDAKLRFPMPVIAETPTQSNSVDCGVFMLNYIVDILHDPQNFVKEARQSESSLVIKWQALSTVQDYGDREQLLSIVDKHKTSEEPPKAPSTDDDDSFIEIEEVRVSKVKRSR